MTAANILTICRLLLIPGFAVALAYYSAGFQEGHPREDLRLLAFWLYTVAALTDGVDGWLARRFNQKTRLGSVLDPIADKALLLTALLFLSWNPGGAFKQLPLWFPIVILSREVLVVLGVVLVWLMSREPEIRPHWIGKTASFLQMVTLGLLLLKIPPAYWQPLLWTSGVGTVISAGIYLVRGGRILSAV